MAVGRAAFQTASDVNTAVGGISDELETLRQRIVRLQAFMTAQDLKLAPFSMTSGDEAIVKSAVSDMNQLLVTIHDGTSNLAVAKDFRQFVSQCTGVPH